MFLTKAESRKHRTSLFVRLIVAGTLLIVAVVFVGLLLSWFTGDHGYGWATVITELAIACVIYYELEEERASRFLSEVLGKPYEDREEIYHEYITAGGQTLEERAENFRRRLWNDAKLRLKCDLQLAHFSRLHYMLRWSLLHRDLQVQWFPHVPIRLWVILSAYLKEVAPQRGEENEFMQIVLQSLDFLEKKGLKPIKIYPAEGQDAVEVSVNDLRQLRSEVNSLLAMTRQ